MTLQLLNYSDEEADIELFRRYLAAQTNEDLTDIADHVDGDSFPARGAAVRRELSRRHLPVPFAWPPEASFNRWTPDQAFSKPDEVVGESVGQV